MCYPTKQQPCEYAAAAVENSARLDNAREAKSVLGRGKREATRHFGVNGLELAWLAWPEQLSGIETTA